MTGKKVRSAKGVMVDFDLMKIKQQLASDPAPTDVKVRQDHIEARLRRRLRKTTISKVTQPPAAVVIPPIEEKKPTAPKKSKQKARRNPENGDT